jgi:serine/threonine protein kinase
VLDGSYRITRVVGSGGFGITYEAEDINLATQVAIKEYYPFDFGDRDATMSVKPKSERHRQTFDWGRSNFLQEARTLARFEHPSIVRVTRVFEANSTAYMVMRFEQGQSFENWLAGLGRPPTQEELDAIVAPMLAALELMHSSDFLHRDIAPDNIIVRADGSPVLLDFGAARRAVAAMSRTMTGIVKAGFSPHEQYSSDSRLQGPWSDLYALGGTLYRAVTGHPPEEATLRVDEDHMPPAVQAAWKGRYRPSFLNGIDACLRVRHADRPRSVAQLRPMLLGKSAVSKPRLERLVEAFKAPSKPQPKTPSRPPQIGRTRRTGIPIAQPPSSRRWVAIAAAVVAVLGGAYGGYEFSRWQPVDAEAEFRRKTAIEAQRQAEVAAAAHRQAEEEARAQTLAKTLAESESKRQQDARVAEERVRREAEAKRLADAAAATAAAEAKRKADEEALARRQAEERMAAAERTRQEAEAKRLADAAAATEAKRKADEEALARRQAEERVAAEKRAAAEQARLEAEAKRVADAAAAKKKADEEALARRQAEERIAAEKRAAADRARADAEAAAAAKKVEEERIAAIDPGKTEENTAAVMLNTEERATFVKRVQEVLKVSHCYDGAVNGSSGTDAQKALDRFVDSARKKGKEKPGRIELAKATASDFDSWLREAEGVKGDLCAKPRPVAQKEPRVREPSRPQQRVQQPRPSYSSGGGGYSSGGGGGSAPIQGVR